MGAAKALRQALAGVDDTLGSASRLLVGFSGGLDSTVLLHVVAQLFPGRVVACHAHHGLHGDADAWEQHCRRTCADWHVEFRSRRLALRDTGHGLEAAARDARYRWFEDELEAGEVLLLAHHLDDQAETLLLRLLRGAGPDGLSGMPGRRTIGAATLVRPFLAVPRDVLRTYARDAGLSWVEDPSNRSSDFDRSYLRNEVMPLLEARWPGYRKTFGRAATQLAAMVADTQPPSLEDCTAITGEPGFTTASLPCDIDVAARSIRAWLRGRGLAMPPAARLHEFQRQLAEGDGAELRYGSITLSRYRDVVLLRPSESTESVPSRTVPVGENISLPGLGDLCVTLDQDPPAGLMLRGRRSGDKLLMNDGRHRPFKQLCQELGVPPWWRARLPLICADSGEGDKVLAIASLWLSAEARELGLEVLWTPDHGDVH